MTKNKKKEDIELNVKINKQKLLKGLGVVAVVLVVMGLAFFASNGYHKETKTFEFTDITIDEYLERMNGSDKSIIYIARPTCSWCQKQSPILKKVAATHDLNVYYLNTQDFYDSEKNDYNEKGWKLINSVPKFQEQNGFGTPGTIIVQNGAVVDGVYGYVEASELENLFSRNGLINE